MDTDLGHGRFNVQGVYVVWHSGRDAGALKAGHGVIKECLKAERTDPKVLEYELNGLYFTWAAQIPKDQLDGVVRYLCDNLKPKAQEGVPSAEPVEVNLPEL